MSLTSGDTAAGAAVKNCGGNARLATHRDLFESGASDDNNITKGAKRLHQNHTQNR